MEKQEYFESIYILNYSKLVRFAQEFLFSKADAENVVQNVFMNLWEKDSLFVTTKNLSAYLFTTTKNRCIDFLRHSLVVQESVSEIQEEYLRTMQVNLDSLSAFDSDFIGEKDIETILTEAIEQLPEKCRLIFVMSKLEGKKQKVIAEELNISINTIESQIAIAYKRLRHELKDFLHLFLFIFLLK